MATDENVPVAFRERKPRGDLRKTSFGFSLRSNKRSSNDEGLEETVGRQRDSRGSQGVSVLQRRAHGSGPYLPEEVWPSDYVDRARRTTLHTDTTTPFHRYEKKITPRYLEEDVSTNSSDEFLSSRISLRVRICLGWLSLLVPLPLLLWDKQAYKALYAFVSIGLLWLLRPVPLAISSLLPIVAFPLMGISDTASTCSFYFNESVLLCLASSVMSSILHQRGIQKRLTLRLTGAMGGSLRCQLFSLMATTCLSAMVLGAPGAASVAIPIAESVAREYQRKPPSGPKDDEKDHRDKSSATEGFSLGEDRADCTRKVFLIGVVLSAITSSPACLTGAPANVFLRGFLEMEGYPEMITYSKWITTNIFGAAVSFIALWVFLVHFDVRKFEGDEPAASEVKASIQALSASELEPFTWQEAMTAACYGITLLGMYFRAPPFMQGWPEYVGVNEWIGEPTPLLFAIFFVVTFLSRPPLSHVEVAPLWNQAEAAIPWSTLLVMGAGFALNSAIKKTELFAVLMSGTTARLGLSAISLQITLSVAVSLLAELRGGVALCALVLPLVVKLSDYSHFHPLKIALPVTLSCSMGLFFSVASPGNNLLMAKERISKGNLAISGLFTHIVYVTTAVTVTNTIAVPVFNMTQIPRRKYDLV